MDTILRIQQGDTWSLEIAWTDDEGLPVDLTGATAKMQMRPSAGSEVLVLELSSANGRIVVDPAGKINLLVSAEDTALLPAKSGVYDLEVTRTSGVVKKLIRGSYLVTPEVTR
jgi:hypothetical protein